MGQGPSGVLAQAAKRIGYYAPDDPEPGSEAGRYWAYKTGQKWLAGPSTLIWWCMLFVSMCFDKAGEIDAIGGFSYNTDVTINHVRAHPEAYFVSAYEAEPGDVVIFNWDWNSTTDHVGIVEANLGGGVLQTIEGNTSSGAYGSQSAGNGVWRRRRSENISHVIRPAWSGGSSGYTSTGALVVDGWIGYASTRRAQQLVGTIADGVISGQDSDNEDYLEAFTSIEWDEGGSQLVSAIQRRVGAVDDGYLGPNTVKAMQRKLGVTADGYFGPISGRAWQTRMNSGALF